MRSFPEPKPWRAGVAALWLSLLALAACATPPKGELDYVKPDAYTIENPSKDRALATGIGCGFTNQDALTKARDTAAFNLRTLTGGANYRVSYQVLRTVPDPHQVCLEVRAQATPQELR